MYKTFIKRLHTAIESEETVLLQMKNNISNMVLRMSMQLDSCECEITENNYATVLYLTDGFTEFRITVDPSSVSWVDQDGFIIKKTIGEEIIIDFLRF